MYNNYSKTYAMKKAQISAFIIFGILLVVLIAIIFFITKNQNHISEKDTTGNTNKIQTFLEECTENVAQYGLYKSGVQGGFLVLPANYFKSITDITYGYNQKGENPNNKVLTPTSSLVEDQVKEYIKEHIDSCYDALKTIPDISIEKKGEPIIELSLNKKDSFVKVSTPITISLAKNVQIEKIEVTRYIEVPLLTTLVDVSNFLHNIQTEKIKDTELQTFSLDNLLSSNTNTTVFIENDNAIFVHTLQNSKSVQSKPYLFAYAVQIE